MYSIVFGCGNVCKEIKTIYVHREPKFIHDCICCRCNSTRNEDPYADTKALHKHIISNGNVSVGTVFFKGHLHIYVTIMAYRTHKVHVDIVLSQVKDTLSNGQNGEL